MRTLGFRLMLIALIAASSVGIASALQPQPQPMRPIDDNKTKAKRETRERRDDRDERGERDRRRDNRDRRDVKRPTKRFVPPDRNVRWQLGITGRDTDTGVVVERVIANSAAARAGLEPDDVIVTVNGYQVGIVEGIKFDLGDEINELADGDGIVTLLIQNRRGRRLENARVQLDRARDHHGPYDPILTGTVNYLERIALPPRSILHVELVELDRRGQRIRAVDAQRIVINGRNRIDFRFDYDRRQIDPNRRYAIEASIRDDARTIMRTRDTYYVLTDNAPSHIDVRVMP